MFEFGETGENLMINGEMSSTPAAKVKLHPKRSMKLSKVKVHDWKLNCNYILHKCRKYRRTEYISYLLYKTT